MRNSSPSCWSLLLTFLALCITPFAMDDTVSLWMRLLIWMIVGLFAISVDRNSKAGCWGFLFSFLSLGFILFAISDKVSQWILLLIWSFLLRQLHVLNIMRVLYNPWLRHFLVGLCASLAYHFLEAFIVSGLNSILARTIIIANVYGMFHTRRTRLVKGSRWYSSPFLLVFPCIILGWLLCGQLTQVLSNSQVAVVIALLAVLLSLRGLIEIPATTAFLGLFIAHNNAVFFWLALPSIVASIIGKECISFILQRSFDGALRDFNKSIRLLSIITWLAAVFQPEYYRAGLLYSGALYMDFGQFEKASRYYKKSIRFAKNDTYTTFRIVPLIAECLIQTGQQEDVIKYLEQWLSLLKDQKASKLQRQALRGTFWQRLFAEFVGGKVPFTIEDVMAVLMGMCQVQLLMMLSKSHHYLGDLQQALTYKNEILMLLDGTGNDKVDHKGLLNRLEEMQEFTETLLWQLPSLGISLNSFEKFKDQLYDIYQILAKVKGTTLATLADIYSDHLNQHDKALNLATQALALYQKAHIKTREAIQHVYIGNILARQGRLEDAQEHYEIALSGTGHWESDLPPEHQLTSSIVQIHMASLFLDNRKFDRAILLYSQIKEKRLKSLKDVWSIRLQLGTGIAFYRLNRISQAREVLLDGLALAERLKHRDGQRLLYFWLAKTYEAGDAHEDALTAYIYYEKSIELLEETRNSLIDEEDRIDYFGTDSRIEAYQRVVLLCIHLDKWGDGFNYVERGKARALLDSLAATSSEASQVKPLVFTDIQQLLRL